MFLVKGYRAERMLVARFTRIHHMLKESTEGRGYC
jgi:hypothetical protein